MGPGVLFWLSQASGTHAGKNKTKQNTQKHKINLKKKVRRENVLLASSMKDGNGDS